jgi:hypothetical protein
LEEFVSACDHGGVTQLVTVSGTVDLGSGDGMLVARVKGAVAAEEVRKTTARIRRKKLELAERGLPSGGGGRPFGYDFDAMTVMPVEAAMIRAAADKVLHGATLLSIRNEWRHSGVPPVGGGTWATKSVRNTLIRPRYAGLREHRGVVLGEAQWPAIVDRVVWEQVQAILTNPTRRKAPTNAKYPLKGLLVCGECGHPMPAMPRGQVRMYGCRKSLGGTRCGHVQVTADRIEDYVIPLLKQLADTPKVRDLLEAENTATADELRALLLEKGRQEALLIKLEDAFGDGTLSKEAFSRQRRRIEARIEPLEQQINTIRGNSALGRLGPELNDAWPRMTVDEQQSVMRMLVSHINVSRQLKAGNKFDPERVSFVWRSGALAQAVGLGDNGELDLARLDDVWRTDAVKRILKQNTDVFPDVLVASAEATGVDMGTYAPTGLFKRGTEIVGVTLSSDNADESDLIMIELSEIETATNVT